MLNNQVPQRNFRCALFNAPNELIAQWADLVNKWSENRGLPIEELIKTVMRERREKGAEVPWPWIAELD